MGLDQPLEDSHKTLSRSGTSWEETLGHLYYPGELERIDKENLEGMEGHRELMTL